MPFGLCNAPATFQRCMLAIFHDMIEESVEVFMDDFSVFRDSFDKCLNNHDKMLQRYLVLNWEKCHFMVKEGIVLGHKVSGTGFEVDKAKINVISKLPPPTNIKDAPFEFDDECQKAFELLKDKLTCAPVIVSPNWNLTFELMCDASDFAVGAVLSKKDEFDMEIKNRKGIENVAADHLSRIENEEISDDSEVDDNFPGETLMEINTRNEPWKNPTSSKYVLMGFIAVLAILVTRAYQSRQHGLFVTACELYDVQQVYFDIINMVSPDQMGLVSLRETRLAEKGDALHHWGP
ncbi:reverse transcriptase domain-containing protein [Tanacetum coccineum]